MFFFSFTVLGFKYNRRLVSFRRRRHKSNRRKSQLKCTTNIRKVSDRITDVQIKNTES